MKPLLSFLSVIAALVLGTLFLSGAISPFLVEESRLEPQSSRPSLQKIVQEGKEEVLSPPPLLRKEQAPPPSSRLTRDGVLRGTNQMRAEDNLPALQEEALLHAAAAKKAHDILEKQYFAHVSPLGIGAGELVAAEGYAFLRIGENLALGGFKDDEAIVRAWMESPGHRANILNASYREIGVAVEKGIFEGDPVWVGVQIFGIPESACPEPNHGLLREVEAEESELDRRYQELEAMRQEIEETRPKRGQEYQEKVRVYNLRVEEYNALLEETKRDAAAYNASVTLFNQCLLKLSGGSS